MDDGRIELGLGDLENPDATVSQSYETAVSLAKREANPVTSFMMGKIKIDGNMGMLMGLAGALGKLADGDGDPRRRVLGPHRASRCRCRRRARAAGSVGVEHVGLCVGDLAADPHGPAACAHAAARHGSQVVHADLDRDVAASGLERAAQAESHRGVGERGDHAPVREPLDVQVVVGELQAAA